MNRTDGLALLTRLYAAWQTAGKNSSQKPRAAYLAALEMYVTLTGEDCELVARAIIAGAA